MRKTLTAFFLIMTATAASAETTVREYDDHVVIEVTGAPQSPEEKALREQQDRISEMEYERRQLAAELERLNRKEEGTETVDIRQRRAAMIEKRRQMQQVDDQLRDLGYQPADTMSANSGSTANTP